MRVPSAVLRPTTCTETDAYCPRARDTGDPGPTVNLRTARPPPGSPTVTLTVQPTRAVVLFTRGWSMIAPRKGWLRKGLRGGAPSKRRLVVVSSSAKPRVYSAHRTPVTCGLSGP